MAFRKANDTKYYDIAHRAQIQDRLIAASNQRCNLYKTYLKRINTYQNGIFGTLTTILGGAGAIVTGADSSRILSGLAGISSGTRAEPNQAIFESISTSIIIPGIEKTRAEILADIMTKRGKKLSEYTIEGAMADAIKYHGACSMDMGISYAQKSIQSFDDARQTAYNTRATIKLVGKWNRLHPPYNEIILCIFPLNVSVRDAETQPINLPLLRLHGR